MSENGNAGGQGSALAAIDDALAGDRVTAREPAERELQELALAIRAEAPTPRPEFAAELERTVADGFPRRGDGRAARLADRLRLSRPRLGAIAAAASVAVAVVAGVSIYTGGATDQRSATTLEAPSGQEPASPDAGDEALGTSSRKLGGDEMTAPGEAQVIVPPPPAGGGEALGERDRRVQRSASMTLAAPVDELDDVAAGVADVAERHRGFVLRSSVTSGDGDESGVGSGSFELRVPVAELDPTLAELGDLAEVSSQTRTQEDVTAPFTSIEDRLRAATAQREGLLRRLEGAASDAEEQSLRRRIGSVTRRVSSLRAELRTIERRTAFAAVSVSLTEVEEDDAGGTGAAIDDARDSLVGALGLAVRVLGVLLPIALVAGLGWMAARALRRRRRESALG